MENEITEKYLLTLHRYYLWSTFMHDFMGQKLTEGNHKENEVEVFMYMSYWYATLYVVIEGWEKLKYSDPRIDELIKSPNVDLLRRYRNGVVHFQKDYFDARIVAFWTRSSERVEWLETLSSEFGRFFLEKLRKKKEKAN